MNNNFGTVIQPFDTRREVAILPSLDLTVAFATQHWLHCAKETLARYPFFHVALSGGSTPAAVYRQLASPPYRDQIDWKRIKFFWSDERLVPHDHPDSNYKMAMEAGLKSLPILPEHLFPMPTDLKPEENAALYEKTVQEQIPHARFDYIMLGMGEDAHTASLFPRTHALEVDDRSVTANFLPDKKIWRLTMTYRTLNAAHICIVLVTGSNKAQACQLALEGEENYHLYPVGKVGTERHPCLWILDKDAAAKLENIEVVAPREE